MSNEKNSGKSGQPAGQGRFHKITLPAPGESENTGRISTSGYFDNSLAPILRINSGDTVAVETGTHLMGRMVPGVQAGEWISMYKEEMAQYPGTHFYPDPATGVEKTERRPNHAHLTGPIYVEGAEPGDILQIEILEIVPKEHGFNIIPEPSFVKQGLLADDFPEGRVKWYKANLEKNSFDFLPGVKLPLRPFPGTLGVLLPEPGRYTNVPPGKHAGNLDCKELIAGTVLYVPVWVKGAGVVTGDSHLAQGDGEVNVSALEGAFKNITLRITTRKDLGHKVDWPFISTPQHWITLGINTNLHEACRMAVRKAIRFLKNHYGMPEDEGYAFCSMGVDLRVTQVANFANGIHAMIPKSAFGGEEFASKNSLLL